MRIIVDESEFDTDCQQCESNDNLQLDASTSVNQQKAHYFEALTQIGKLYPIGSSISEEEVSSLSSLPDVLFAAFHKVPREGTACRLLQHSKGALMLTGEYNRGWTFRDATINLVTSHRQAEQLQIGLGPASPNLEVFPPRLSNNEFFLPSEDEIRSSRMKRTISSQCFHLVFAGRWIANKGICQIIRALNLWPIVDAQLTLVGNFEPNFQISQSNALHVTFSDFFRREIQEQNHRIRLICEPSLQPKYLREVYWAADCFLYPSFHEDENFGMAPREAILCGIPAVVTDFCGLGQLNKVQGGLIETYPTLGGVRYSLHGLRKAIESVRTWCDQERNDYRVYNASLVTAECDPNRSLEALRHAAEGLLRSEPGPAPIRGDQRSKELIDRWAIVGPNSFKMAISLGGSPPPEGLFVDGTGNPSDNWYSEPHLLQAIQSFYTTLKAPPIVILGEPYRGFWRVALWQEELAIVEFGFPGPRLKRFERKQWSALAESARIGATGEIEFCPKTIASAEPIRQLVELGYLVPDHIDARS